MKTQNEKSRDVRKYRFMFFNIGLIFSLMLVITAFEWEFEVNDMNLVTNENLDSLPVIYIPATDQIPKPPKPEPRKKKPNPDANRIKLKPEPVNITTKIDKFIDETDSIPPLIDNVPPEVVQDPPPDASPPIHAVPEGGFEAFYAYVQMKVSSGLTERDIRLLHGQPKRMIVSFIVEKNGQISHVEMKIGFTENVNQTTVEAVLDSGRWEPARRNGRRVRQIFNLPIRIRPN